MHFHAYHHLDHALSLKQTKSENPISLFILNKNSPVLLIPDLSEKIQNLSLNEK